MLQNLGIDPIERWPFRLADDHQREFDVGQARLRLYGRERIGTVVFGDDAMQPLLGAITLEDFLLAVDPIGRRLVETPGLLMSLRDD